MTSVGRQALGRLLPRAGERRSLVLQALLILGLGSIVAIVIATAIGNLQARGIPFGASFLTERSGFTISESILSYGPDDSNLWAIAAGIANTLFLSVLVIVLSTILGTLLGIARISSNPLIAGLARAWVETARNTPLILLLIFVYALWWQVLPADRAIQIMPGVLASMRGIVVPRVSFEWSGAAMFLCFVGAIAALIIARAAASSVQASGGRRPPYVAATCTVLLLCLVVVLVGAWGQVSVAWPRFENADFVSGLALTPELFTITFGLTLYTTGFIAEIVRSGITAVPKGQWEAARSLALPPSRVLRLVIMPQMLRIIVPSMTSQYINVIKNTTLALAVGYADFMVVMGTIINKTSHAIEGTVIIICVYLSINLAMSALLNWYNRRVAIKER
ncbi:amino acid ABC transporter permease [Steroidobacter sp.]|uniref:amino acid ABC transporter permease n=1 Tax=Steroidobacter sp. TaxID=1978227 RepID=UPI001A63768B|nr:ABC transporter permease subunit [Steroidobacter sp.]MBL8267151.1 ABC transporter permease subunit [Steroidobacter sp.]